MSLAFSRLPRTTTSKDYQLRILLIGSSVFEMKRASIPWTKWNWQARHYRRIDERDLLTIPRTSFLRKIMRKDQLSPKSVTDRRRSKKIAPGLLRPSGGRRT